MSFAILPSGSIPLSLSVGLGRLISRALLVQVPHFIVVHSDACYEVVAEALAFLLETAPLFICHDLRLRWTAAKACDSTAFDHMKNMQKLHLVDIAIVVLVGDVESGIEIELCGHDLLSRPAAELLHERREGLLRQAVHLGGTTVAPAHKALY